MDGCTVPYHLGGQLALVFTQSVIIVITMLLKSVSRFHSLDPILPKTKTKKDDSPRVSCPAKVLISNSISILIIVATVQAIFGSNTKTMEMTRFRLFLLNLTNLSKWIMAQNIFEFMDLPTWALKWAIIQLTSSNLLQNRPFFLNKRITSKKAKWKRFAFKGREGGTTFGCFLL